MLYYAIFFLKKENIYHKIQYSKVMKFDVSAALFGVIAGALVVYFSISSLGSGSADISELSILFWYIYLIYKIISLFFNTQSETSFIVLAMGFFYLLFYIISGFFYKLWSKLFRNFS